jgi:hypothetical protein
MAPALVSGRVLDSPAGASDHHDVAVTLDTELADTSGIWHYG